VLTGSVRAVAVALAGIALTLVAFMFDASPLFVPGVGFALLGAGGAAWVAAIAAGARVGRSLDADRVVEGEPLEGTLEISGGALGVRGAEVRDPLAGRPLLLRGSRRRATIRVVARFDRRGLVTVEPPSLTLRDPLALAQRAGWCVTPPQQVLVLPRTERVRWHDRGGANRLDGPAAAARSQALVAVEVDGLRPYQPGTPASRIYWPGYARGAGLLERRMQPDEDRRPLIVLDSRGEFPDEQLDAAVRAAASLTLELARACGCLLLLPGDRRPLAIEPDLIAWPAAHSRLALVEGGPRAPVPVLAGARARPGALVYVSAAQRSRPPSYLGSGVTVLVTPAVDGAGGRARFEVAGCVGRLVGRRVAASEVAA
jgi:uncharacterized protein (DUF58 family)